MTGRERYVLGPGRKPAVVKPPDRRCESCGGTGWIEEPNTRRPVARCRCMTADEETTER